MIAKTFEQCPECGGIHTKRCSRKYHEYTARRVDSKPEMVPWTPELAAEMKKVGEEIRKTQARIWAIGREEPVRRVHVDPWGRVTGEVPQDPLEKPVRRVRVDALGRVVGDERT